jgi:RNA polymerase sigma-70 factor (ECF subfamily)
MASDADLVVQVAGGDEAALRELLRRYERPLSSFIYRHTAGRDVQDIFQETWLRVVRQAARFDAAARFSTWLFQIAINLCRDWHRRQRDTEALDEQFASERDEAADTERRLDTLRLLARLPEDQREVLILRFFHDLSEKEVAELVGCPLGTVKSRMHHALAKLGQLVKSDRS